MGLTIAQNRVIIGYSVTSLEELIDYLGQVNQVPRPDPRPSQHLSRQSTPKIPPSSSLQRSRREASSTQSPQPSSQSKQQGTPSNTPVRQSEQPSEKPSERATSSLEQDANNIPEVPDAGPGPGSDSDDELDLGHEEEEALSETPRTFGPADLADLDHWAYAIPGSSPTLYREAPKLPTCGPWEIPLPPTMDPQVHVQPNQFALQPLLGGVRIQIIQSPPRLKVELSGIQRAAMLMQ